MSDSNQTDTPTLTPVCVVGSSTDPAVQDAAQQFRQLVLPYLPPRVQQHLTRNADQRDSMLANVVSQVERLPESIAMSQLSDLVVDVATEAGAASERPETDEAFILFHSTRRLRLSALPNMDQVVIEQLLKSGDLWTADAFDGGEFGEGHAVQQGDIGLVATALANSGPGAGPNNLARLLELRVEYREEDGTMSKSCTIHVPASMTGLMLKSKVISELGMDGGFQHYYLRLDGHAFGSRTPMGEHPSLSAGQAPGVLVMEPVGDRPKAQGMT